MPRAKKQMTASFTTSGSYNTNPLEYLSDLVSCQHCTANLSSILFGSQITNDCTPTGCIGGCPPNYLLDVGIAAGAVAGAVLLIATPVGLFIYCKYCNGWSCVKRVGKRNTYEPIQ